MTDLYADNIEVHPPKGTHEATLTKWGWPSPSLLKRHKRSIVEHKVWMPTPEDKEPPF